jgi:hypothetical protein
MNVIIARDIKLFKYKFPWAGYWAGYCSIGDNKRSYIVTGSFIGGVASNEKILCNKEITIKIGYKTLFLSKDNLLLLSESNIVIDLNTKVMYHSKKTSREIKQNLSTRKFIKIKNS